MNNKSNSILALSMGVIISSFLIGCGGGGGSESSGGGNSGSSSSTSTIPSTYTVSGTVPGTRIEAYCNDGSFHSIASTHNGTSQHPFSLPLPINSECKLVMITNETALNPSDYIITPIELESSSKVGTYLKMDKNVNLGYVPLEISNPGVRTALRVVINDQTLSLKELSSDPMDNDNDGILNVYEDDDGDDIINKYDSRDDNDDDNDGTVNEDEEDDDNDGILDSEELDNDEDNDGISDIYDKDKDNDGNKDNDNFNNVSNNLPTSFTSNNGRILGSQCAQCHGTNGVSSSGIDSIRGEDELTHEIYDDDPIMAAQAKGYTTSEIIAIESWLNNIQ